MTHRLRFALAASALVGAFDASPSSGEDADPGFMVTNGAVHAVAHHDGTLYVGGQFSEVSSATGAGIVFDPTTGASLPGFPQVVGRVYATCGDASGGWYIGGLFTSVGGQPRANVAHIASDLSVTAWNPGTDGAVLALELGPTLTLYLGGQFTNVGGLPRNRIAAVASSGAVTAWDPSSSGDVLALEVTSGSVYAGGTFNLIGGAARSNIAILSTTTGLATAWNPGCNGTVRALQLVARPGPTNTLIVGGTFTTIASAARSNLAELSLAGAGSATAWSPNPNGTVHSFLERSPVTYVGGEFTTIGGQSRNRIASVDPTTGLATAWNPNADGAVQALAWSNFHVFVGGRFANVGGQARPRLAKLDEVTGNAVAWDPRPNEAVLAITPGAGGAIFAGGEFSGLSGIPRRNFAAFDAATGTLLPLAPDPDGAVRALHLATYGTALQAIYLGGDFTTVGGQPRTRLAALDGATGGVSAFAPYVDGPVYALALRDTVLYVGGNFFDFAHTDGNYAGAVGVRAAEPISWNPFANGIVFAIATTSTDVYLGGAFTELVGQPRSRVGAMEPTNSTLRAWNPNASATVRTLLVTGSTIYLGGDFTTVGGQPRNRIAAVNSSGVLQAFTANANGVVRALVPSAGGILAGGDFTDIGGQSRRRLAELDATTGAVSPWSASVADREVWALSVRGPVVYAGGTFRGVGPLPQAQLAAIGSAPAPNCPPLALTSSAGGSPQPIVSGDIDGNGILDLVVGNHTLPPTATVLWGLGIAGIGNGKFGTTQVLPLTMRPRDLVLADFDVDGRPELVVSQSGSSGQLTVFPNLGGSFGTPLQYPLFGRVDGLAVADMDQDGILDILAALQDSASVFDQGGIVLLRGTGSGGVWDGSFASPMRIFGGMHAARRILAHDFNGDGTLDLAGLNIGTTVGLDWFLPGLVETCQNLLANGPIQESGVGLATGDFNEDGWTDLVSLGQRSLRVRLKNASLDPQCAGNPWFVNQPTVPLASTPRDLVVFDYTQDGILDLVYTLDSLGTVEMLPGLGVGDVGDGTFGGPVQIATLDAWGLTVGDFVAGGTPELAVSQSACGTVTVLEPGSPPLPAPIVLVAPNGGESWPQAGLPPLPVADARAETPWVLEGAVASPALASPGTAATLASTQQIVWTKGPGIQGVDVAVSRNGGATWQPIATNASGTSMTWIVTPPASANTRVRVSDTVSGVRADQSDASFTIVSGTTDVGPGGDLPAVAAFRLDDRNPARGPMRFRLDVPRATEAEVLVYGASGRLVRTLVRGPVAAGRHDVVWDSRDAGGSEVAAGVYFVRGRIEGFSAVKKVVVVR